MKHGFIEVILAIYGQKPNGNPDLVALQESLLDFGSETDDNRNCANALELDGNKIVLGSSRETLGDLLSKCETDEVFEAIHRVVPELSLSEAEALLRFCTLLILAFEQMSPRANQ